MHSGPLARSFLEQPISTTEMYLESPEHSAHCGYAHDSILHTGGTLRRTDALSSQLVQDDVMGQGFLIFLNKRIHGFIMRSLQEVHI
jgi:hypothetical protein